MKSLAMPSANNKVILQSVTNLLLDEHPGTSFLWTNTKNL